METAKIIYHKICQIEKIISGIFLVLIMAIVFLSAIGRAVGHPLNWAIDISAFLFAWTAFFSADVAMRQDRHLSVKFIILKLPKKVQYYITLVNYLIIVVFLGYLIRFGFIQTYNARFRTFQGIPELSYAWATLSVPVGSILLLISTIVKLYQVYKSKEAASLKMENKEKVDQLSD
ncbi:MAG: TRAP transporter small permease [Halanaerobiales bacterium]|nr:TRAP transporter small permease [Halanaerobiales bacterium]